MAVTKIYTGAAFEEVRYKTFDGTSWIEVPKFWDGSAWVDLNSQGPIVTAGNVVHSTFKQGGSGAICRVKWDNDGDSYLSTNVGGYGASYETWLTSGLNTEVWVSRTIIFGTLEADTIGSGRPIMSSDRFLGVQKNNFGTKQANGDVTFWDAASGGNILDTATWSVSATWEDGS